MCYTLLFCVILLLRCLLFCFYTITIQFTVHDIDFYQARLPVSDNKPDYRAAITSCTVDGIQVLKIVAVTYTGNFYRYDLLFYYPCM